MEYRSIGQMSNEEIKKLKRNELVQRLCDSNFSFEEKERIFLSNRGQKCRSCGLLRINKKLSPNSFSDLHKRLICIDHHNEHTKPKIIGPNMNQNPININGNENIENLEDRPNIQIPIEEPEQISIDEPEANPSANNRNNNGINNYIEEEVNGEYVTLDKFNEAMTTNDKRFQNVEGRLQSVEGRLDSVEGRLQSVEGRLQSVEGRLDSVEGRLKSVEGRLLNVESGLGNVQIGLTNVQTDLANLKKGLEYVHDEQKKTNSSLLTFMGQVNASLQEINQKINK